MTHADQYIEIKSWIKSVSKEVVDAIQRSDIPIGHIGQIVESRLWEFTVIHGLILASGEQCGNPGSPRSPTQSDPDFRCGHS